MAPYQLKLEEHRTHLHATVVGERTAENAQRFLEEAYAACVAAGYSSLLLDMQLSGPSLDPDSIMHVIAARAADGAKLRKIAYVQSGSDDASMPYTAESEAINRGVNVRVFRDVRAAERWLAEGWRFGAT